MNQIDWARAAVGKLNQFRHHSQHLCVVVGLCCGHLRVLLCLLFSWSFPSQPFLSSRSLVHRFFSQQAKL
jgi:hypothetical protein